MLSSNEETFRVTLNHEIEEYDHFTEEVSWKPRTKEEI